MAKSRHHKHKTYGEYLGSIITSAGFGLIVIIFALWFLSPSAQIVDKRVFSQQDSFAGECQADDDICQLLLRSFPKNMSMTLRGVNESCASSRTVTLTLAAQNADWVIIGNSHQFIDEDWQQFNGSLSRTWELSGGDGEKTVYAIFQSASSDKSIIQYANILLDEENKCGAGTSTTQTNTTTTQVVEQNDSTVQAQGDWAAQSGEEVIVDSYGAMEDPEELAYIAAQQSGSSSISQSNDAVEEVGQEKEEDEVIEKEDLQSGFIKVEEKIEEKEVVQEKSATSQCSSTFTFTSFLSNGAISSEVRAVQELLQCLGYFPETISPTAIFGPVTEQAVKEFQSNHNIDSVGYIGPGTRAALNSYR